MEPMLCRSHNPKARRYFRRFLIGAAWFGLLTILAVHLIDVVCVFVQVDGLNTAINMEGVLDLAILSNGMGVARLNSVDAVKSLSLVLLFTGAVLAAFMIRHRTHEG